MKTGLNHAVRVTVAALSIMLGLGTTVPATAQCPGDVVATGGIDGTDLAAVLGAWGTNGQGPLITDLNSDGIVNGGDLAMVLGGWGPCPPAITSILPNNGPTSGGTPITITGNYFSGAATVTLGGIPATDVEVVDTTTITAVTPAVPAGSVDIVVEVGGRIGTASNGFTFQHPAIAAIAPNTGSTWGGTTITITGSFFTGPATVTLGGVPATDVQVLNATTITAVTPAVPAGSVDVVVAVGGRVITLASGFTFGGGPGTVRAWGYNDLGQCNVPADLGPCSAVAAGKWHTVALRTDGTVRAWGYNSHGQCNIPADLGPCTAIAAGAEHTVVLRTDGTVQAWGYNEFGQADVPNDLGPCTAVAAGCYHTIALRTDGTVRAWGWNIFGQCNIPADLGTCTAIAGGGYHTVALSCIYPSYCIPRVWGSCAYSVCKPNDYGPRASKIAAGFYSTILLRVPWESSGVRVFGFCAADSTGECVVPTDVLNHCSAIAGGEGHTVAIRNDGTVRAWGSNWAGQCDVPSDLGPCTAIAAGSSHTVAIQK